MLWPVAMQVRGSGRGWCLGPLPPLYVIQSSVIGGGKETGPQPMTESCSEEGVISGH